MTEAATADMVQLIPLDLIAPNPHNPRRTFDPAALAELADSIRDVGVVQPIVLRPITDALRDIVVARHGEQYGLIAGERRWRAARLAGLTAIPAVIRSNLRESDSKVIALIENLQREDLPLVELCVGTSELVTWFEERLLVEPDPDGRTALELASKRLGKSKAWVSKHAAFARFPDPIRELATEGHVTDLEMLHSLKRIAELDEEEFGYVVDEILNPDMATTPITREALRDIVQNLESRAQRREEQERSQDDDEAHGGEDEGAGSGQDDLFTPPKEKSEPKRKESKFEREQRLRAEQLAAIEPDLRRYAREQRKSILEAVERASGAIDTNFEFSIGKSPYGHWSTSGGDVPTSTANAAYHCTLRGSSDQAGAIIEALNPSHEIRFHLAVPIDKLRAIEEIIGRKIAISEMFSVGGRKLAQGAKAIDAISHAKQTADAKAAAAQIFSQSTAGDVAKFLKACTERKKGERVLSSDLYKAYDAWCGRHGLKPLSLNSPEWGAAIEQAKIQKIRSNGSRYVDLRILVGADD
jgi:ParB family chromosome partitioning protein